MVNFKFQPCKSAQTNPTPDLSLTLSLTQTPTLTLWGARGRQGQSRVFLWRFSKKIPGGRKAASTSKISILHRALGPPVLHIGRVVYFWSLVLFSGVPPYGGGIQRIPRDEVCPKPSREKPRNGAQRTCFYHFFNGFLLFRGTSVGR